jgi:uncharacterized protein YbbC (DUF1343 family)
MLRRVVCCTALLAFGFVLCAQLPVTGAERTACYVPQLLGQRVALVVNQTSTIGQRHLADTLQGLGVDIKFIFAPEHGFRGSAEAGETVKDGIDARTGIPLRSIYGKSKKPSAADLAQVDLVVFDIQDVGVRFYTYISTLFYVAEACAEQRKPLLVLDRPNPNGHYVDGPVLEPKMKSFVGIAPIPIVHGCTVGELAHMYRNERWIQSATDLQLEVIPCDNYTHQTPYTLPIKPSPNIPDQRSVLLYPSICLFEGTKLSVGRGTDTPFQRFGYPSFAAGRIEFIPCPNEGSAEPPYKGEFCAGFDLSNTPVDELYQKPLIELEWLLYFYENSPNRDDYFLKNDFFSKLAGTRTLRQQIEAGKNAADIRASWEPGLARYRQIRDKCLLYP